MKKNQIANLIMVAVIVLIAAAGILTVGHIQGWFDADNGESAVLTQLRGIITMERDGVAYTAENETVLRRGDRITCGAGATSAIRIGKDRLILGENAEIVISEPDAAAFSATVIRGEVFVNSAGALTLAFDGRETAFSGTVALLSVRSGAQSISIFEGAVEDASAGEILEWVDGKQSIDELKIESLNSFTIGQLRAANESRILCFSNGDLDALIAAREAEMQAQLRTPETTAPEHTDPTVPETTAVPTEETVPPEATAPTGEEPETTDSPATQPPVTEPEETEAPVTEPEETEPPTTEAPTEPENTCTISIRCDTILNNMENLDPAKAGYVPADGVILYPKTVTFTEGETVFDVLSRVCAAYGIQIEYSWTPMYDSYYIEGINNLYEFDCGSESGWMYRVNGWFPNYGCSSYTVSNGDNIVWCYTCVGLGADVGG